MSPEVDSSSILEELESYDPEHDHSRPVRYAEICRTLPFYDGSSAGLTSVNISNFAELAYCPFKIWHVVRGTPVVRPPPVARILQKGTGLHAEREGRLLEVVRKAKPATKRQLRDPTVDLVELPEFPGRFKRELWLYRARLDGLARESGNLVIRELKTGRYARKPDHLLQVWGYCFASPGAMSKATGNDLRANGLTWEVEYPVLGMTWGPYEFRANQASLMRKALTLFELVGSAALTGGQVDLRWRSFPAKCAPCGFAHSCEWKVERRLPTPATNARLIPLEQFSPTSEPTRSSNGDHRGSRHGDHRTRTVP